MVPEGKGTASCGQHGKWGRRPTAANKMASVVALAKSNPESAPKEKTDKML